MNKVISWLRSVQLRQIVTVFLISLTFLFSTAFDINGNSLQARAEAVTPEAKEYKVQDNERELSKRAERIQEDAEKSAKLLQAEGKQVKNRAAESEDKGKNIIDVVREKLNLDEPIDPGTKQAAEQLKEAVTGDSD